MQTQSLGWIIKAALIAVIAVVVVPTVFDAVWSDAQTCLKWNDSECLSTTKDCRGSYCANTSNYCIRCVNGTGFTLLKLVPMIFVGTVVIAGALLAYAKFS